MKPIVILKNWSTAFLIPGEYQAPECCFPCLKGEVYGHPSVDLHDGEVVWTSRLKNLDLKQKRAETSHTVYILEGPPDPKWVEYLKSINFDLDKLPCEWDKDYD